MNKISLISFLLVSSNAFAVDFDKKMQEKEQEYNKIRLELFTQVTYTRSWEMQRWRLLHGNEPQEKKEFLRRSMVAYAFNYWILVKKQIIKDVPSFDKLIKDSFLNDELPIEMASNPLAPPLGIPGPQLKVEEYKILATEFVQFVSDH
jgi:hypothetical protein